MSSWLFPIVVELCILLLFCVALFHLRRSLTARRVALWISIWALYAATSFLAMWRVASPDPFLLLLYTPLQVALALALVGMAFHLERQKDRLRVLREQVRRLTAETKSRLDKDPLTDLSNRSALDRWMENERDFVGMVVVCDLDDFKTLNDRLGHLVGDEILRDIGQLVRTSIRHEDFAFRWGGDEFVICFRTLDRGLVIERMRSLESRLQHFHIRHHGPVAVHFSWGLAAVTPNRPVREAVDEADRLMYEAKRRRRPADSVTASRAEI